MGVRAVSRASIQHSSYILPVGSLWLATLLQGGEGQLDFQIPAEGCESETSSLNLSMEKKLIGHH